MLDQLKRDIQQIGRDDDGSRSLGLLIAVISFALIWYWYIDNYDTRLYLLVLLFFIGMAAVVKPRHFSLLYQLWMMVAVVIGFFVFRLFLLVVYLVAVVPIALVLRIVGKDLLSIKWKTQVKSYWRHRSGEVDVKQMEEPF